MRRLTADLVLREIFQGGKLVLLDQITGGIPVVGCLESDLPRTLTRRADLVLLMADGSILHIEIQTRCSKRMPYRMLIYWALLSERLGKPIRQVVIYVGSGEMTMPDFIKKDSTTHRFDILDMRTVAAKAMMKGGPGDLALALLAADGPERLREIVDRLLALPSKEREQALAWMVVTGGIRELGSRIELELRRRGIGMDLMRIPAFKQAWQQAEASGHAAGHAAGVQEGVLQERSASLRRILRHRFGSVPKWAADQIAAASQSQLERWFTRSLDADSLDAVFRKR